MIKNYFIKDINRNIETVIKADDRDNISDEVIEYVVTNEIAKKIKDFFESYNNYVGVNGVWISGFFGSGKSHLLKILSYVLENKEYDGYECGEIFAEKIENDTKLKEEVLTATKTPSESILFNIDQQAQITTKSDENAILSVFYKVFYDHLGFYGAKIHVAEFEQWLSGEGHYNEFLENYEKLQSSPWEKDRRKYFSPKVKKGISAVLKELFKDDNNYENIIDQLRKDGTISIEDFSFRVNEYIKSKQKGFRLNFFVDEVGQYISDNTKLMLNLQTIAESLATKTKGGSWILVTSQEDMETVVGDMNQQQKNDFSRIQARFKIKIPLTSANVDEVIEKRLLKKTKEAESKLENIFTKENKHLETLLSFSEVGVQFKGYKDKSDYSSKFPFVPFHFDLFQHSRISLSSHNAFQGKHSSVGERSMLGVFQQVIQAMGEKDDKALVSFDMMYEGIKNELKGEIQQTIILADKNLENRFALKVLKALFLVKYFKNFKTTKRNISVLMIDDVNVDLNIHDKKIGEALNTLENQSYVQRNGDIYEFLTDDEKDIEEEIKNTSVDDQAPTQLLKEIFFDSIIQDNRIKFADNNQSYDFTSRIDGALIGREKELEIDIITENYYNYKNTSIMQSQTMGSASMKIKLAADATFMKDVRMYLKTDKYIKQANNSSTSNEIKRILQDKGQQNVERRKNILILAKKTLAEATIFMNGSEYTTSTSSDAKTRVVNAFQDLIKTVYASLKMLGANQYSEETVKNIIWSRQDELFVDDETTISEAELEILNTVQRRKNQSERTSLLEIKNILAKKPYGWYPNAIWSVIAKLYKRGKIELKQNTEILENEEVSNALLNSANHSTTLIDPQVEIDPRLIKNLKQVYVDVFDEPCSFIEAKDVANDFKAKLNEMFLDVNKLLIQKREYTFLESLEPFYSNLDRWANREYSFYINNLNEFEDDLLDAKEDVLDPIKRFMNGEQRIIFDTIKDVVEGNTANLDYIEGDEFDTLQTLINSKTPYKGNGVQLAKAALDSLQVKVLAAIGKEKQIFETKLTEILESIQATKEFPKLDSLQKNQVLRPFEELKSKIKKERFISNIKVTTNTLEDSLYQDQLNLMLSLLAPKDKEGKVAEPQATYIKNTSIHIEYLKKELTTEEDVENYIEALKEAYLERIAQKLRITL